MRAMNLCQGHKKNFFVQDKMEGGKNLLLKNHRTLLHNKYHCACTLHICGSPPFLAELF